MKQEDLNEMLAMALLAKDSGFSTISVDPVHLIDVIGVAMDKQADNWVSVDDIEPTSERVKYWVLFPDGSVIFCNMNDYKQYGGNTNYWQDFSYSDHCMTGTKYIEVVAPAAPVEGE